MNFQEADDAKDEDRLAQAWDEGYREASGDYPWPDPETGRTPNPHRSQA